MFPTTHRSVVQGVRSDDPTERERSWEQLAAAYWKPAYKHLRLKWKQSPQGAEDTVQSFFARAVEKGFFAAYDPTQSRFRTFFKLCLDRHQSNERRKPVLDVDFAQAEAELSHAGGADPDAVFDLEWKRHLFTTAIEALRRELDPAVFRVFEQYDLCDGARPRYEDLARAHGLPVTTVTNHLSKVRRLLRERIQRELGALEEQL